MNAIEALNGVRTVTLECERKKARVGLVKITPGLAMHWLDGAENFRDSKDHRIIRYRLAMKEGLWELNCDTIKIGKNGKCIDGQHRLKACILENKPFVSLVAFDVPAVVETDRGMPRTLTQELEFRGYKYSSALATTLGYVWFCLNSKSKNWATQASRRTTPSTVHLMKVLEEHKELLVGLMPLACKNVKVVSTNTVAATLAVILIQGGYSLEDAQNFVEGLADPDLRMTDPRRILRERLMANKMSKAKLRPQDIMALIVKAWNAFIQGRSMGKTSLRWDANREEFPEIVTKKELAC